MPFLISTDHIVILHVVLVFEPFKELFNELMNISIFRKVAPPFIPVVVDEDGKDKRLKMLIKLRTWLWLIRNVRTKCKEKAGVVREGVVVLLLVEHATVDDVGVGHS